MTKSWTTTKLIAVGSLGALLFILEVLPAITNTLAPSTAFSGPLSTFLYAVAVSICLLTVREFGAATIMFTVYSVFSIPFFLLGPPGFMFKIFIGMGAGLIADILYLFLKRSELAASLVVPGPMLYYIAVTVTELAKTFNIPGMEATTNVLYTPVIIVGILPFGAIGGYFGYLIYQKIKDTTVVKRIQGV